MKSFVDLEIRNTIEKAFDIIKNDSNLSAKDKLEDYTTIYDMTKIICAEKRREILNEYEYCKECDDYYKKKFFEDIVKEKEYQYCTNRLTGGYLDDYEYETRKDLFKYHVCPKGHENEIGII